MRGSQSTRSVRRKLGSFRWTRWAATVCLLALPTPLPAGYGYNSPTVGSPVGPGTAPPSSYEGGLVNTPNPLSDPGNSVITGNVRGGKHFRGSIPYSSTSSFGAPLGSTQLDSFLRYSAVPEELGRYSSDYSTFYSPTGTVTTMQPGYRGVFAPTSPRVAGGLMQYRVEQPADVMPITEMPQLRPSGGERSAALDATMGAWQRAPYVPMSRPPEEMREVISDELGDRLPQRDFRRPGDQFMTPQEYQRQLEQLRQETDITREPVQNPRQDAAQPQPLGQPLPAPQSPIRPQDTRPPSLTPETGEPTTPAPPDGSQVAPSARSLSRPLTPVNRIDAIFTPQTPGQTPSQADTGKLPALQRIEETARAFDPRAKSAEQSPDEASADDASASDRVSSLMNRLRTASGSSGAAPGANAEPGSSQGASTDRARLTPEDATILSREQFDRYMRAAQLYVRGGRYYRAADSFTLASLYAPRDPRPHLGRTHVLLAAGEYISSALALAKAIELDSRQVLKKTDLIEVVGGPDLFVRRVTDLEESIERSDAPQLQFLLAYIYYQMDRPDAAQTAIEAAARGLPDSPAVDLLKTAIGG